MQLLGKNLGALARARCAGAPAVEAGEIVDGERDGDFFVHIGKESRKKRRG